MSSPNCKDKGVWVLVMFQIMKGYVLGLTGDDMEIYEENM